jgi:hypothetical protein
VSRARETRPTPSLYYEYVVFGRTSRAHAMLRRATSRLALRTPAAATWPLLYRPPLHPGQGPAPIAERFSPSLVRCFASGQTPPPTDKKEPSRWERIKAMFYEHGPVFVACAPAPFESQPAWQ